MSLQCIQCAMEHYNIFIIPPRLLYPSTSPVVIRSSRSPVATLVRVHSTEATTDPFTSTRKGLAHETCTLDSAARHWRGTAALCYQRIPGNPVVLVIPAQLLFPGLCRLFAWSVIHIETFATPGTGQRRPCPTLKLSN